MLTHTHEIKLPSNVATCHAWNAENTILAVCHGTPEVFLYAVAMESEGKSTVKSMAKLSEHNQVVSSMKWSKSGLLLTCSHDRTSYVWCKVRTSIKLFTGSPVAVTGVLLQRLRHAMFYKKCLVYRTFIAHRASRRRENHGRSKWSSRDYSAQLCVSAGRPMTPNSQSAVAPRAAVFVPIRKRTTGGQEGSYARHITRRLFALRGILTMSG